MAGMATVTLTAQAGVQTVTLTGIATHSIDTLEIVQLDNDSELWIGIDNPAFTAAGDAGVNVMRDGIVTAEFSLQKADHVNGDDLEFNVICADGGRVHFWARS